MEKIFKALSEMSRLRILSLLMEDAMCVCEIECSLNLTQSNASRHLSALRQSGIVESFKKAQWTYYRMHEDFSIQHGDLWVYLNKHLPRLPTYEQDRRAYEVCKVNKNCCKTNKPH